MKEEKSIEFVGADNLRLQKEIETLKKQRQNDWAFQENELKKSVDLNRSLKIKLEISEGQVNELKKLAAENSSIVTQLQSEIHNLERFREFFNEMNSDVQDLIKGNYKSRDGLKKDSQKLKAILKTLKTIPSK